MLATNNDIDNKTNYILYNDPNKVLVNIIEIWKITLILILVEDPWIGKVCTDLKLNLTIFLSHNGSYKTAKQGKFCFKYYHLICDKSEKKLVSIKFKNRKKVLLAYYQQKITLYDRLIVYDW